MPSWKKKKNETGVTDSVLTTGPDLCVHNVSQLVHTAQSAAAQVGSGRCPPANVPFLFCPSLPLLQLYRAFVKFIHRITVHLSPAWVRLQNGGRAEWPCRVLKAKMAVQRLAQCTALAVRRDDQDDEDDDVDDEHHLISGREKQRKGWSNEMNIERK